MNPIDFVCVGNIKNKELLTIFEKMIEAIEESFKSHSYLELYSDYLNVYDN